jgi:hypothetical protein
MSKTDQPVITIFLLNNRTTVSNVSRDRNKSPWPEVISV